MEKADVTRLGMIFAIQAVIEGMKAGNKYRLQNDEPMEYGPAAFQEKSEQLKYISYCDNVQLLNFQYKREVV